MPLANMSPRDQADGFRNQIHEVSSHDNRSYDDEKSIAQSIMEEEQLMVDKTTLAGNFHILRRIAVTVPRLYYLVMNVFVPMVVLICISFLFGYLVALVESKGEISRNNEAVRNSYVKFLQAEVERADLYKTTREAAETAATCWKQQYERNNFWMAGEPEVDQAVTANASDCSLTMDQGRYATKQDPASYLLGSEGPSVLSFNWITCPRSLDVEGIRAKMDIATQSIPYINNFYLSFLTQQAANTALENLTQEQATDFALSAASGGDDCHVHVAGGALFWFSIMTTVGWGNTAPVTDQGKMLVFVFGFISIIAFAALITTAGYVIATIIDDFFLLRGMGYMTQGTPAIFLWFCAILGWMFVLALWYMNFAKMGHVMPTALKDNLWLSYITLTTVGLGDLYVPHEEFSSPDMFSFPFLCLLGFTAVSTFASKLRNAMLIWFPTDQTLEHILESRRERIEDMEKPRLKGQEAMRMIQIDPSDPSFDTSTYRNKNSSPTQFITRLKGLDDHVIERTMRYDPADPTFQIDASSGTSKNSNPRQFVARVMGMDDYNVENTMLHDPAFLSKNTRATQFIARRKGVDDFDVQRVMRDDPADPTIQIDARSCTSMNSRPTQSIVRLKGVDDYDVEKTMRDDRSGPTFQIDISCRMKNSSLSQYIARLKGDHDYDLGQTVSEKLDDTSYSC